MTPAPFTSGLTAPLFGDPEAAEVMSDRAFVANMITVEVAFARACAAVGLVPHAAAVRIAQKLSTVTLGLETLGAGMTQAGVPVPALIHALHAHLGEDAQALHWGATSQDIVDCAHVLQWRDLLELLETRLAQTLDDLQAVSATHAETLMAARTRSQIATPITLGLRIATWAQPLITLENDLPALRSKLLRVQFGGAAGSGSVAAGQAEPLTLAFADALGLKSGPCWHLDRSGPQALGGWLVALTAALGKIARDLVISGRSEIAEISAGKGGGSSTMPQKSNPVSAEAVITLAQFTASLQPLLAQAAMPLEERDGAVWALEWLALPQMAVAAAASLRHIQGLIGAFQPDAARMRAMLETGQGAAMAETASFVLARHMPRAAAADRVKQALTQDVPLAQALADGPETDPLENWPDLLDPKRAIHAAEAMRQRIFATRRAQG